MDISDYEAELQEEALLQEELLMQEMEDISSNVPIVPQPVLNPLNSFVTPTLRKEKEKYVL